MSVAVRLDSMVKSVINAFLCRDARMDTVPSRSSASARRAGMDCSVLSVSINTSLRFLPSLLIN